MLAREAETTAATEYFILRYGDCSSNAVFSGCDYSDYKKSVRVEGQVKSDLSELYAKERLKERIETGLRRLKRTENDKVR